MTDSTLTKESTSAFIANDASELREVMSSGARLIGVVYEDVIVFAQSGAADHEVLRKPRYILEKLNDD